MIDWSTTFPYVLIASLVLFTIGIYGIITCKTFLRAVFGIELLLLTANLLLLSFGLGSDTPIISDPFAQTLSLMIVAISAVFLILGSAINRLLLENNAEILDFNFEIEDITLEKSKPQEQDDETKSTEAPKEELEE